MIDLLVLAAILAACTAGGLLLLRVAGALPDARDEHLLAGVATGLGEHVDEDVEELHVGAWPPRDVAGRIDREGRDRGVRVVPR